MRSPVNRRSLPALAATALLGSGVLVTLPGAAVAAPPGDPARDVIANLFQWNWASVARECTDHLGPAGFGAVQVSPPQESVSLPDNQPAHPWWEVYQPVGYQLTSRLGDRAVFSGMVGACHDAGIKVYADVVINHMTGQQDGGTGYGGSTFPDKYSYPGVYGRDDFHKHPDDCPNPDGTVQNYDNQAEVQNCELVELSDLRTSAGHVRDRLAGYLNDLISLGVDGFRVDAAKHINAADIGAIKEKLTGQPYLFQEVIPGGAVNPPDYEGNGDVLEFTYGRKLKEQFHGNIANLETFGESWGMRPAGKSVTFVDNHDTERDGSTLSYKDGAAYTLANIFSLAWGYGTPQVFSGFTFPERDSSPPAEGNGMVRDVDCGNGQWTCTTRQQAIRGMVGWHNAARGKPVANWWSNGNNAIAFSRGSAGFVAINNSGAELSQEFSTGLPAGRYCDVVHGEGVGGDCTGPAVEVSGSGTATITVPVKDAVAIHTAG